MSKKIKFKAGEYVYSKKQRMTSVITASREYGGYIKRQGAPLCCPWDDLVLATKEQKREYIIAQNKVRAEEKAKKISKEWKFKPFYGGKEVLARKRKAPRKGDIGHIKEILRYLNLKCAAQHPEKSLDKRYPISAVWHRPGILVTKEPIGNNRGLVSKKSAYNYGWVLVTEWMHLENDSHFLAFIKGLTAKYKPIGLTFELVFYTHPKVRYSGLISISPTPGMRTWKLPNEKQNDTIG